MTESTLKNRNDIDENYKWDLLPIYENEELWEKDFVFVQESLIKYNDYFGRLDDSEILIKCLRFDEYLGIKLERLHLYAFLAKDLDLKNTKYQAMEGRIKNLYSEIMQASAFIRPEILTIPEEKISKFLEDNDDLKLYEHFFNDMFRLKKHSLDNETEKLLASASPALSASHEVFSLLKNADMKYPSVKDEDGQDVEITEGLFYSALYSTDRNFRKRVYYNYYKPYKTFENTLSALFNGNLKAQIFSSRSRKYGSSRESALASNNIPLSVYDNLVDTAKDNSGVLQRWVEIKKRVLNLKEIHPYDMYVTLFPNEFKTYSYDEGVDLVRQALRPMGDEYMEALDLAFENRRVDVYETENKRSGAYSSGVTYGVNPFVLLNWTDTLNDVSTLAHEMGHNMHSYFTGKNQKPVYAGYSIFLAEVASITNENLLHDYLMSKAETKEEKLSLIEMYLNKIVSTFFRQTQFAEFEMEVYQRTENGESLTPDVLCQLYSDIFKNYYGESVVCDEEETYTWSRVPHFYYGFYVYQYATGLAAAEVLSAQIKSEGMAGAGKMMRFLSAGKSDYSINILKNAGVDMSSPEPVIAVTQKMTELLDELESLLD